MSTKQKRRSQKKEESSIPELIGEDYSPINLEIEQSNLQTTLDSLFTIVRAQSDAIRTIGARLKQFEAHSSAVTSEIFDLQKKFKTQSAQIGEIGQSLETKASQASLQNFTEEMHATIDNVEEVIAALDDSMGEAHELLDERLEVVEGEVAAVLPAVEGLLQPFKEAITQQQDELKKDQDEMSSQLQALVSLLLTKVDRDELECLLERIGCLHEDEFANHYWDSVADDTKDFVMDIVNRFEMVERRFEENPNWKASHEDDEMRRLISEIEPPHQQARRGSVASLSSDPSEADKQRPGRHPSTTSKDLRTSIAKKKRDSISLAPNPLDDDSPISPPLGPSAEPIPPPIDVPIDPRAARLQRQQRRKERADLQAKEEEIKKKEKQEDLESLAKLTKAAGKSARVLKRAESMVSVSDAASVSGAMSDSESDVVVVREVETIREVPATKDSEDEVQETTEAIDKVLGNDADVGGGIDARKLKKWIIKRLLADKNEARKENEGHWMALKEKIDWLIDESRYFVRTSKPLRSAGGARTISKITIKGSFEAPRAAANQFSAQRMKNLKRQEFVTQWKRMRAEKKDSRHSAIRRGSLALAPESPMPSARAQTSPLRDVGNTVQRGEWVSRPLSEHERRSIELRGRSQSPQRAGGMGESLTRQDSMSWRGREVDLNQRDFQDWPQRGKEKPKYPPGVKIDEGPTQYDLAAKQLEELSSAMEKDINKSSHKSSPLRHESSPSATVHHPTGTPVWDNLQRGGNLQKADSSQSLSVNQWHVESSWAADDSGPSATPMSAPRVEPEPSAATMEASPTPAYDKPDASQVPERDSGPGVSFGPGKDYEGFEDAKRLLEERSATL